MKDWKTFCTEVYQPQATVGQLRAAAGGCQAECGIYAGSIQLFDSILLMIARTEAGKSLVVYPESAVSERFNGETVVLDHDTALVCSMDLANCRTLRELFPFTRPVSHQGRPVTLGLGDRLGLASPGHIRLVRQYDVFPVLAQQSMRELGLTGRTYDDVLAAASWAVFQEGYERGFGADGDHLKTEQEVKLALDAGVSMITLDCSEHIRNDFAAMNDLDVAAAYAALPEDERLAVEERFLDRSFGIDGGQPIRFNQADLQRIFLTYRDAIRHTIYIYHHVVNRCQRLIDFELSIDETLTPTSPASHYLVAVLLQEQGVAITSLAPRFCGEFQKGIDYRGDLDRFSGEFDNHCRIARQLGYKISVHSGSDKFSVFPTVGALTGGTYHLKTAGTNWLEAVRVIAGTDPGLYRDMHRFALDHLDEARQYYHISADPDRIAPLDSIDDADLPALMDQDDARQVLHITYGLLLKARAEDGSDLFRSRIYQLLDREEEAYMAMLYRHIGRHLTALGLEMAAADQA